MKEVHRYTSVAISLHWLIAFFIIGLLAMGKYMTHLEVDDPLRYTLTQLHKSVGITVLLLALFRFFWRITHKPPALPNSASSFERVASHLTHLLMYLLMVVIPISGWVMVSSSPLNLETVLYGVIPWPHISFLTTTPDREMIAEQSALLHMWLGNGILLLVLMHISAALFHQWVRKDQLISRMVVSDYHRKSGDSNHGLVAGVLMAAAGGLYLISAIDGRSGVPGSAGADSIALVGSDKATTNQNLTEMAAQAGASTAGFTAVQSGAPLDGEFGDVRLALSLDKEKVTSASLTAVVMTGSVKTDDAQLDATMVTSDWFASEEFPEATFNSTGFVQTGDSSYTVTGDLTIRGNTNTVMFELVLEQGVGRGEFTINRSDYGVGDAGQDEFVDPDVVIRFTVPNSG